MTSCKNIFLRSAAFPVSPLSKIWYYSYLKRAEIVCGSGLLLILAPSTLGKESEEMKKNLKTCRRWAVLLGADFKSEIAEIM